MLDSLKSLKDLRQELDADSRLMSVAIGDVECKTQVRVVFDADGIKELADSIRENGLQQPIVVYEDEVKGKYVVLHGERRYRACKLLKMDNIDVIVRDKPEGENLSLSQIVENIQRENMKPYELSDAVATLVEKGLSQAEVARRIGKGKTYVANLFSVSKLSEEARQLALDLDCEDITALSLLSTLMAQYGEEIIRRMTQFKLKDRRLTRYDLLSWRDDLKAKDAPKPVATPKKKYTSTEPTIAKQYLPKDIHKVKWSNYRIAVVFSSALGDNLKGFLPPNYMCDEDGKIPVIHKGKIYSINCYDVVIMGVVHLDDFSED